MTISRVSLVINKEYLALQIRSMDNRFHSEAKLPWLYDYPLANHIATYKSSTNREMSLFSRIYPSFGYLRKIFQPIGLRYSLFKHSLWPLEMKSTFSKRYCKNRLWGMLSLMDCGFSYIQVFRGFWNSISMKEIGFVLAMKYSWAKIYITKFNYGEFLKRLCFWKFTIGIILFSRFINSLNRPVFNILA